MLVIMFIAILNQKTTRPMYTFGVFSFVFGLVTFFPVMNDILMSAVRSMTIIYGVYLLSVIMIVQKAGLAHRVLLYMFAIVPSVIWIFLSIGKVM
jgi:hypothetical protein